MKFSKYLAAAGWAALVFTLFAGWQMALAQQTTADILGTVTDPTGAVVQGATVTVESLATHEIHTTTATGAGDFVVNLLQPGPYSVTVTATGFQKFFVTSVTLAAGDRTRVNAQLTVGNTNQTVTVEAVASSLQTDSSVLSSDIGEKTTQDLPLNGRNFTQLLTLQPGVSEGETNGGLISGAELDDQRQSAAFEANGQSEVMNNQQIDGADNYERLIGSISVRPSIDAISEMNVQTNTYTAEAGRTGGAVVNIITKSGTDQFHGDVFEFFRNDILNAADFNVGGPPIKGEWRQNQFGGSLGGPIKRNKAFFFGSYEGYRLVQGTAPSIGDVLSNAEYAELQAGAPLDFSDRATNDPQWSPVPVPTTGCSIGGACDPAGIMSLKLLPAPNTTQIITGTNGNQITVPAYANGGKKIQNSSVYDGRLDYTFNPSNSFYARYIYNNVFTDAIGYAPKVTLPGVTGAIDPEGFSTAPDKDWDVLMNYIHTFNQHLVFEGKAAYTRSDNESFPSSEGQNPENAWAPGSNINTNAYDSDASGLPIIAMVAGGLGSGGVVFMPLKDQDNTFQYLGALTWTRGTHNIKFGASSIRRQITSTQSSFPEGIWLFWNFAYLAQGQFFSNDGRSLELDAPHIRVWEPAFYVQDDWHVNRHLTLNLGVRYDLFTPYSEIQGRFATWDNDNQTYLVGNNVSTGTSPYIKYNAGNTAGVLTDYHGLQPRFGFAFNPGHNLVFRGGFGMSYVPMNTTSDANMKDPPFVATSNACSSPGFWNAFSPETCDSVYGAGMYDTFSKGFPVPGPAQITGVGATIPDAVSIHYRTSYVEQFNLTVQKAWGDNVLTASYVGLLGREMPQLITDLNAGPLSATGLQQSNRAFYSEFPNLGEVGYFQSGGKSSYNALQASFDRRMSHGLSFNINYTHSHSLDNSTGLSQEGEVGYSTVPSLVDTRDYGNSPIDFRDHFAGTASYALPFGKNAEGFEGALIKGWQGNFIISWLSGQPFEVINNNTNVAGTTANADRPNEVGPWKNSNPSINSFFKTSAFAVQTPGTLGNERRNQLYGPHFRHADLSIFKTFPVHESVNVEFRAEGFNIANEANWATPNATIGSSTFGEVTGMTYSYTPRVLQFALKLNF